MSQEKIRELVWGIAKVGPTIPVCTDLITWEMSRMMLYKAVRDATAQPAEAHLYNKGNALAKWEI